MVSFGTLQTVHICQSESTCDYFSLNTRATEWRFFFFSEQRSVRDYAASFGTLTTELNLMRHETRAGGAGSIRAQNIKRTLLAASSNRFVSQQQSTLMAGCSGRLAE